MKKFASLLLLGALSLTACSVQAAPNALNAKQQNIVTVAAFAAQGNLLNLKGALNQALDEGMTINEAKEVLVQLYAYCGFPRSLNGINLLLAVLDERKAAGIADETGRDASPVDPQRDRYAIGEKMQTTLVGRPVAGRTYEFAPIIGVFLKEHLFCDIFERDVLSWQERELATVGALAGMGNVNAQLGSHMRGSMNLGVTREQLQSAVKVVGDRVDKKLGANAQQVFDKL